VSATFQWARRLHRACAAILAALALVHRVLTFRLYSMWTPEAVWFLGAGPWPAAPRCRELGARRRRAVRHAHRPCGSVGEVCLRDVRSCRSGCCAGSPGVRNRARARWTIACGPTDTATLHESLAPRPTLAACSRGSRDPVASRFPLRYHLCANARLHCFLPTVAPPPAAGRRCALQGFGWRGGRGDGGWLFHAGASG